MSNTTEQVANTQNLASHEKKHIGKKELIAFAIAAGGQGMVYAMMSSYISDFYVNVLAVSPIFVFVLMLGARIWDAVNDPMMGALVDNTQTKKWGKMKPYLIITPIPIAILTFLIFFVPSNTMSETSKMVYASITYVLWGMVYTISDVPFWGICTITTPNPKERGNMISLGRTVNGIGSAIPMVLVMALPVVLSWFGYEQKSLENWRLTYMISAIFVSVVGMLLFARFFFYAKERIVAVKKEKVPTKEVVKALKSNRPLLLVVIMGVLSFTRYMVQAGAIHAARYAFVQVNISTTNLIFGVCIAIGMFGAMLLMPKLFKKFNYKQIIIFSGLLGLAGGIAMFLTGFTLLDSPNIIYILIPFLVVMGIPLGAYNVVSYAMIADSIDYMEWKSGIRKEGLSSASQTFINKLGNAFATAFIVLMYIIVDLDPSLVAATDNSLTYADIASDSAQVGMFAVVSILPGIGLGLSTIPIFFYKLVGAEKDKVISEINAKRSSVEAK